MTPHSACCQRWRDWSSIHGKKPPNWRSCHGKVQLRGWPRPLQPYPEGPPPHLEHGLIAARLIALLPRHRDSETPAGQTVEDASDIRKFRAVCMLPLLSLDSTLKPHSPRGGFFWSLKRRALFSCPSGLNCSDSVLRPNQHCMRGDGESTWNSSSAAKT